ncbi:hypothetical protein D3H65_08640 [Paraflavitalea soli]|uniref:Uncharacterized protein n=1 Tax=Paraflavitalea soli TaxID=2315862 RepID=A0A3B7MHZ4_9BACT|nr:hypothetical protein D3H65_08640 [Paraflavitalea soli]
MKNKDQCFSKHLHPFCYLLADQAEPPKYFAMMKKLNKVNRPLPTQLPLYQHNKNILFFQEV